MSMSPPSSFSILSFSLFPPPPLHFGVVVYGKSNTTSPSFSPNDESSPFSFPPSSLLSVEQFRLSPSSSPSSFPSFLPLLSVQYDGLEGKERWHTWASPKIAFLRRIELPHAFQAQARINLRQEINFLKSSKFAFPHMVPLSLSLSFLSTE